MVLAALEWVEVDIGGRRCLRLTGVPARVMRLLALHAEQLDKPVGRLEIRWGAQSVDLYVSQQIAHDVQ